MSLELGVLLLLAIVGPATFAVFEVETPAWRKVLKWTLICAITLGLARTLGHWALVVPLLLAGVGLLVHWRWCHRHGIHPLHATPRKRYYALRGWTWRE